MPETNNVRLQNLREMTVQIRRAATDEIVGTGIAVSTNGAIVTCAHVVEAAIGVHPRNANSSEIGVYFPQARGGETRARKAIVAKCFPQHDDDVVLLQLTGGSSPLAPEQIAVLGHAEKSEWHDFHSYGYRRLDKYIAGLAHGKILGCVERPVNENVQCDPVQIESNHINRGMSGAAVLDIERNLVIGIVSEMWVPDATMKDRDTAWAVNARVLSLDPIGLQVLDEPLEMRPAPQPRADAEQTRGAIAPTNRFAWNGAPDVLPEWTGRDDLLEKITQDWLDPQKHVTGLIGFGGEGKSSLARKWVDAICKGVGGGVQLNAPTPDMATPDGVFWWGFYENRSVDEFLEAALKWITGGGVDPRAVPSSSVRAQIIGAMLGAGRYLFVLDGLEVMQHQEGDRFGLLQSNDLRDLLTYFARPDNASFCLITSRVPVLDLMEYTTYTHRDVDRLSAADGRVLLQRLGVKGQDTALDKLVADWDGHALTLSLLSAILTERYNGDVAHVADLPPPTMNEPRYERVHRVLRRYDEHLTDAEREFLKLFSVFRTPVNESAFAKLFLPLISKPESLQSKTGNENGELGALEKSVASLVNYRVLHLEVRDRTYTTHPLIRNHYLALIKGDHIQEKYTHEHVKNYYLSIAGGMPQYPTLEDLRPLIEAVHHACQAGAYDEAIQIYNERISQRSRFVILHQLGAYDTALSILLGFFPTQDFVSEPNVSKPRDKGLIFATAGFSLMSLGQMREATSVYEIGNAIDLGQNDWRNASVNYRNLSELHAYLGTLKVSADAAASALTLAQRVENKPYEMVSLAFQAWAAHLQNDMQSANASFKQAESIEKQIESLDYLRDNIGIFHADHLRRTGNAVYARRVTVANLKISEQRHSPRYVSQCHRVLGDLDADASQHTGAREHYDIALKIARSESFRPALIEALLARGRWAAKYMKDASSAFNNLNEALGYAVDGGYRIYEADIRVALAWANAVDSSQSSVDRHQKAKAEAERALRMSEEMGYYWGKVDAEEVLKEIRGQVQRSVN